MRLRWCLQALLAGAVLGAAPCWAQDDDDEVGIGPAPAEARSIVTRAVAAMGGPERLGRVEAAVMAVETPPEQVQERHTLRMRGRYMHYASRRPSGAGFDVILARGQSFLCDRDAQGRVTYVEDLREVDAKEGSYERDILFMPLLLPLLLEKNARMDYRGKNSVGDDIVRAMIEPPVESDGEAFVIRLRFDEDTHVLVAAMGTVPWGTDKGKKRYCFYGDYRPTSGGLLLPHKLEDQRGKDARPRAFSVRWELDPQLPPAMWLRPNLEADDGKEDG